MSVHLLDYCHREMQILYSGHLLVNSRVAMSVRMNMQASIADATGCNVSINAQDAG